MNMKKVKLSDVFEAYGSHYVVKYHASIEKGIIFEIEKKFGRHQSSNKNSFWLINDIISEFDSLITEDHKNLVDFHSEEIAQLSKGFLSTLINKDKKDKIKYHQDRIQDLNKVYDYFKKDIYMYDTTKIVNIHESEMKVHDYIHIVDLRNKENIILETVYVDSLTPFFDNENNISIKTNIRAFTVAMDDVELINLTFTDNYYSPAEGYHIFNDREKAYDFSIDELMKSEYNENIKMRLSLAKKIDNLFGY